MYASQCVIPFAWNSRALQPAEQGMDIVCHKGGMRFQCWAEIRLNSDVELARADSKPATSTRFQRFRFVHLFQTEQLTVKLTRLTFAFLWGRNLNMIDFCYGHIPIMQRAASASHAQAIQLAGEQR